MNEFFSAGPFSRRSAYWLTLIGSALLILLAVVFGMLPEANDDAAIASLLAASDCSWVPFIHPLLAAPLQLLMQKAPIVNWWSVVLFAACIFGWAGTSYSFCRILPRGLFSITAVPALLLSYRVIVYHLTFTRSAAFCVIGGGMLILLAVFSDTEQREERWCYALGRFLLTALSDAEQREKHWYYGLGLFLLALGSCIRPSSALLILFFLGISAIFLLLRTFLHRMTHDIFQRCLQRGILLLPVLLLVGGLYLTSSPKADSPAGEYTAFQQKRSNLIDYSYNYPDWNENKKDYLAAGITRADFRMCFSWNGYDTEYVTGEKLDTLYDFYQPSSLFISARSIYWDLKSFDSICLLFLVLPFLIWDLRQYFLPLLVEGAAAILISLWLASQGRIPNRVFQPLVLAAMLFALAAGVFDRIPLLSEGALRPLAQRMLALKRRLSEIAAAIWQWIRKNRTLILRLLPSVALTLVLVFSVKLPHSAASTEDEPTDTRSRVRSYLSQQDGFFFSVIGGNMPSAPELTDPWVYPESYEVDNVLCLGGWETRMPHITDILSSHDITNPVRALIEREDVFGEYSITVHRFMQEKYGKDVTASRAVSLPDGMYDPLSFASYLHAVPDGTSVPVKLSPVKVDIVSNDDGDYANWSFTGRLDVSAPEGQRLYCNATVGKQRLTFTVDMAKNGSFVGTFYGLPPKADPAAADLVFFFQ